jgi:organic hydroperoxide reductase OsmC/OhrA
MAEIRSPAPEDTVRSMAVTAKVLTFEASLDRAGRMSAEDCPPVGLPEEWTAEHLVLVALLRCSLSSLRFHAQRAGLDSVGAGSANGKITRRSADDRFAFVEISLELDVDVDPPPEEAALGQLLAKAEHGCFISASLTVAPTYRWRVNGVEARATTR